MFKIITFATLVLALPLAATAQETSYPLTIQNGEQVLVFEKTPERAISLNGHTTEVMLELGLARFLIATAYMNYAPFEKHRAEYESIPVLGDDNSYPSLEAVLGTEADFTYARLSAYRDTAVAPQQRLADLGINAYAAKGTLVKGATMEAVYEDIDSIGKIFNVQPRANALIAEYRAEIAEIQAVVANVEKPVKVFVYDSGTDTAYTAGAALQTNLIELAGGQNVFADLSETWENVSWEAAVASAPDVIVINDYGNISAEEKIALLKGNPALSSMPAIQNDRFVILPLPAMFEGVRTAGGVRTLATGFYPELFK